MSTFIRQGGSAIKFAVISDENKRVLGENLRQAGEGLGFIVAALDAADCRVHMPQDIFFGLSSQLNWRSLARRMILKLLSEEAYNVEGIYADSEVNLIDRVARNNNLDTHLIRTELRPLLQNRVFRAPYMFRAFRVAMLHLCLNELKPTIEGEYACQPVLNWLTGAETRISHVRPFQIYTPVNRTTARYFFESTLSWVKHAGIAGTIVVLNNSRVAVTRNPKDGCRYYTKAMTMDHFEVLRELIDDAHRLSALLFVVVADEEFADDESQRGWSLYTALKTRIMNDVRDRNVANPAAALVQLS